MRTSGKTITELNEAELEERFGTSSGPGGQNVNKTSTRVTLRHLPTNLSVTVQDTRSQSRNRQLARERLLQMLQDREREAKLAAQQFREKQRRRSAPKPPAVKRRILEMKKRRSQVKQQRRIRAED